MVWAGRKSLKTEKQGGRVGVAQKTTSRPAQLAPPAAAFRQALSLHERGRIDEAERLYRAVLEVDRTHADALHNLGVICLQRGHLAAAAALTREAVRARPDFTVAYNTLSVALRRSG